METEIAENGYDYDYDSDYVLDFEEDFDEARRKRKFRPVPKPSGRSPAKPAPQQGYVTRNEYTSSMNEVKNQLTAAKAGITKLDSRVNTLANGHEKLAKELAARKKENDGVRKDLKSTREMAALLPLLSSSTKTETIPSTSDIPEGLRGKQILVPSGNSLGAIAPLLLLGMGDSSSGGGDSMGMMLPLILLMGNK